MVPSIFLTQDWHVIPNMLTRITPPPSSSGSVSETKSPEQGWYVVILSFSELFWLMSGSKPNVSDVFLKRIFNLI